VWSARRFPTALNFSFPDPNSYSSFKQLLIYPHEDEWTAFQTHCYSENLLVPGIESETSGSAAMNSYHYIREAIAVKYSMILYIQMLTNSGRRRGR
jgi:hypothetical protein